ncbi:MAG: ATP-binding cassette domain-containing protein [Streptosporangiales bacterium]|nr:ATP-binding cassette domain-containing protein [Streptosporangiales bacterium]
MTLLDVRTVRKTYPGAVALGGVDFAVEPGEVHALLGENGAGKSTLMKVIAGSVTPDAGQIDVDGRRLPLGSPQVAREHGVAIVYQELSLVPSLSVGENVLLGRWPLTRTRTVGWDRLHEEAAQHLARVGLDVRTRTSVRTLRIADRQLVEIAKALCDHVRLLMLDEPTSALSEREAERLFGIIHELRAEGVGVVYVSHMLAEVLRVADRITVLRDGRTVDTVRAGDVLEADLAQMMVGRRISAQPDQRVAAADGDLALRTRGLACRPRLQPVDLELRKGEVVGVFGFVGAGRTRLARTLFGLEPDAAGTVEVSGKRVRITSPADAVAAGLGYLGDDRALGIVPAMSVAENITLASMGRLSRGPVLDVRKQRELASRYIDELAIRASSPDQPAGTLSGGNQQKVVLARWLCSGVRVLVLDDPMRGIDVGAKEEIMRLVRQLAADGIAILYLTSELKEAKALAHRVLVMAGGRIVRAATADASDDQIMAAAGGVHG